VIKLPKDLILFSNEYLAN